MIARKWILGAAVVCALAACKNDLDRVAAVELKGNVPTRITTNAEYFYSDSGLVTHRLRAGTIKEYEGNDERTELSDGLELVFVEKNGTIGSRLTAQRGSVQPGSALMTVQEHVVFINAKGEKLETESLVWEQENARVHTDRPVKITRDHDIIRGQGLDAAEDFSHYTIHEVTGRLYIDRNDTLP